MGPVWGDFRKLVGTVMGEDVHPTTCGRRNWGILILFSNKNLGN